MEQHVFYYLSNHNINSKEIYNWLLNNQNNLNSIFYLDILTIMELEQSKMRKEYLNYLLMNRKRIIYY